LEETSQKGGREHENGTLGNVQGNIGGDSLEKLNRCITGGGMLGNCLINQPPFLSPLPCTFSKEVKAKHESGQNPNTARLHGHFLLSLDSFYFLRTGFI
jgi:hypothetical protein